MSVVDVREAFDQGKLVLDGPTLRFGGLLGPGVYQLVGGSSDRGGQRYLSICSGEAPCFKVILLKVVLSRTTGCGQAAVGCQAALTLYMVGILKLFLVVVVVVVVVVQMTLVMMDEV